MTKQQPSDRLVLGPLVRWVGERAAHVWVETSDGAEVVVRLGERTYTGERFSAHGHHYGMVCVDELEPGSVQDYTVELGGEQVWPPADSSYPPSRIATLEDDKPTRLAFGSCRTSMPHDDEATEEHGVDAMRALGLHMAANDGQEPWPDLVVFLGDQVYADTTSPQMREFIESRRDPEQAPWYELKDFEEYTELYRQAWSDPANRWLLSTLPSLMIFDDHDIRDDWNTSYTWHQEMNETSWWHERLVGGLMTYWIYQHVGNLAPEELGQDPIWQAISSSDDEVDITDVLHEMVESVDREPSVYRFSFRVDLGESRLVVVDSRAARELTPDKRSILDEQEMEWFQQQLTGDVDHLFIGTSLPFLLAPGIHDLESANEALASGAYGRIFKNPAEKLRQAVDLEHWAAFEQGFGEVMEGVMDVARGRRGRAPYTITFLSGDVHNSYITEVLDSEKYGAQSRIVQAVCSPIRNPLPTVARALQAGLGSWLRRPMRAVAGRLGKVPDPRYPWAVVHGPWFDNNIAIAEVKGRDLDLSWLTGDVEGRSSEDPVIKVVSHEVIEGREISA